MLLLFINFYKQDIPALIQKFITEECFNLDSRLVNLNGHFNFLLLHKLAFEQNIYSLTQSFSQS